MRHGFIEGRHYWMRVLKTYRGPRDDILDVFTDVTLFLWRTESIV